MSLPEADALYLATRGLLHEIATESNMTCIVFRNWQLPPGYDRASADLLIRLPGGYPDVPPDMWWIHPGIKLANGQVIQATEVVETHLGRSWQRWSRHFQPGQWKPGIDGVESFLALIGRELHRWVPEPVR
ncbi:MAG: hypothetical protein HZB39_12180 [Planctomycetes bacterium]|nr:hypothetical protein [Planctomycetota bacterium]